MSCYVPQDAGEGSISNIDYLLNQCQSEGRPVAELRLELQRIMHNNAGVYRNQQLLEEGCSKLSELVKSVPRNLKV
jgi:succinate dehydrogenase/fumarate reductase flavoprotein subunit